MTYKNCNKTTRKQYCVIFKVISRILLPSVNHTRPVSKQEILKTSIGEDKPHQKPLPYCIKSSLSVPTLWMGTFIMPSQEAARVWLSFRACDGVRNTTGQHLPREYVPWTNGRAGKRIFFANSAINLTIYILDHSDIRIFVRSIMEYLDWLTYWLMTRSWLQNLS